MGFESLPTGLFKGENKLFKEPIIAFVEALN